MTVSETLDTHVDSRLMSGLDDRSLAARAATDFAAFAELYNRYHCKMFRFVRRHTPSDSIAEDLTAQVFFKALNSAHTFRAEGTYSAWLFRIAHNAIVSWRAERARGEVTLDDLPEEEDPSPPPAAQVLIGETRHRVWDQVSALPEAQREVVSLRYIEDLSIEEVAHKTRRTSGAVRILLHRARARLRKALEGRDGVR